MIYGHRRGLERPGLRDPMGPMRLMGLMRPPHKSHPFTAPSEPPGFATRVHTPIRSPSS
jgi:hypothetical protein